MDSLYGHCITVRQAPFRCVGLWATHWAVEMLSPRSSPQGGLSLLRKPSPHICVTVSYNRSHAADILAVWRGSSDSVGEAHLGELLGGSDPWADSGRTSMSHFNLFNKGVRKEERTGKSPWGPESYPTSHFGLEVYGLKHHPFLWGSCVLTFLPLSAQEYLRRRGKTAGLTSSLTPSFPFRMVPLRRPRWTGCFPHLGRPCCLFPRGWHVRGQGSLAAVTLLHVCVVAASLSNSVVLTPCASPPQVRERAFWREDRSHAGVWSLFWAVFCFWDSHRSPDHPLPISHGSCSFFWETHLYLNTLACCYFHHQNVNHSFEFLGRWNFWGLQLPKLCKQPLFKISLEWVLHREKKMLCGNWALKLPWKYIYNCI